VRALFNGTVHFSAFVSFVLKLHDRRDKPHCATHQDTDHATHQESDLHAGPVRHRSGNCYSQRRGQSCHTADGGEDAPLKLWRDAQAIGVVYVYTSVAVMLSARTIRPAAL